MVRRLAALCACAALTLVAACGDGGDSLDPHASERGERPRLAATIGDSISAGSPLWDPDPQRRQQLGQPVVRSQYQFWVERNLDDWRFRNCAVPGERTDQIERQLKRCIKGADALIVQGGLNDLLQARSPETAAANLEQMVERGKDAKLTVLLAELLPLNADHPSTPEVISGLDRSLITDLNRRIRRIGREQDVQVLPWNSAVREPNDPNRMRTKYTIESIHPSVEGYRRLGETVKRSDLERRR
jgi:lysophospholipase L1-like esterase